MATPGIVGADHYRLAQDVRRTLAQYAELKDIIAMLGLEQLSTELATKFRVDHGRPPTARRDGYLVNFEGVPVLDNTTIERKILFAHDLDALWYVRPELMNAVAAVRGESVARGCLDEITHMFDTGAGGKLRGKKRSGPPRG